MTDPVVTLANEEYLFGCNLAIMRRAICQALERRTRNNPNSETLAEKLKKDVVGVLGELAFARYKNCYPSGSFDYGLPDLVDHEGVAWDTKATTLVGGHLVLVRDAVEEHPERRYVLLTGASTKFLVRGWLLGSDALSRYQVRDLAGNNRAALWIPQGDLVKFASGNGLDHDDRQARPLGASDHVGGAGVAGERDH